MDQTIISSRRSARTTSLLFVIVAVGFALRAASILWGMPVLDSLEWSYHPDETKISSAAINFPASVLEARDLRYPTFFHLLNSVVVLPLRALYALLDMPGDAITLLARMSARILSLLAGTATIYITYRLGRELRGARAGMVAAALCCFSLYHVLNSAVSTTDVMSSFFLALFLLLNLSLFDGAAALRDYLLAGAILGLLIGTKYTGAIAGILPIVLLVSPILVLIREPSRERRAAARSAITGSVALGLTALVVFLATTPAIVLHFDVFIKGMIFERSRMAGFGLDVTAGEVLLGIARDFAVAFGPAIALLFLVSCGYLLAVRRRSGDALFTNTMIVLAVALLAVFNKALLPRYLILITPVVGIVCALALDDAAQRMGRRSNAVLQFLLIAVLLFSAGYTMIGLHLRGNDTRTAAAHYINEQVAPGTDIGVSYQSAEIPWQIHRWQYPKIDFEARHRYKDALELPTILITSSYDLNKIERALASPHLSDQLVWDPAYAGMWYRQKPPSSQLFRFYRDLLQSKAPYRLIATFEKTKYVPIEFPSPTIQIFQRIDEADTIARAGPGT